ncbi:probable elongator complex protein 2, partial [Teleopsis dalmanni]|uniref:probable elongator complex protein 2 n=1 Tax=Teleopsis dalmanni TaxID=139649 RepID=UPI0018CED747
MKFRNIYTSVGCNRRTEAADWGNNGFIIFGASHAVAICDPNYQRCTTKVIHTYRKHKKIVNTVQWLRESWQAKETYFLSGGGDGLAILWHMENIADEPKCYLLEGHESSVNAVTGVKRQGSSWLLGTASSDSTIKLWNFDGTQCACLQTILLSTGFCFSLRLTLLPKSEQALLAFSSDNAKVSLWAEQLPVDEKLQFKPVHQLIGHEDWVRGLDFVYDGNDLLLASSSQDNFIRLWRIAPRTESQVQENKVDIFNLMSEDSGEIKVEEKILQLAENSWFAFSLESVLYGHEGWVCGVHWHKTAEQELLLLSASIDKTLIIWAPTEDGVWMEKVRCGDVGGNSLGFYGAKFAGDGKSIIGHSFHGAFHKWSQSPENDNMWLPSVIVGGHFGEVRDIDWEPSGAYLMSVSADQTTRIHAPWQRDDNTTNVTWHELARPQVHGYDMQAVTILSRYKFASCGEEKIVRTFQAPANFIENFRHITRCTDDKEGETLLSSLPKGASVPSLGLSNKAVYETENLTEKRHVKDEYPENYFVPVSFEQPPQEETLMQNTLWPETQKLYGHGYEIYALASTPDSRIIASSCRATNTEHAGIILWNAETWKKIQNLPAHNLTVTQLRFSPEGRYLLSVSRDRRWSLFERHNRPEEALPVYTLTAQTDKTNGVHTRIIWSCDWSHDEKYFVTTSREGKAVIWTKSEPKTEQNQESSLNSWKALDILEHKNASITAVAFGKRKLTDNAYAVAIGFESGLIKVYKYDTTWTLLLELNNSDAHHSTVKRLHFRPQNVGTSNDNNKNVFHLASCGDDNIVKIYEINFE